MLSFPNIAESRIIDRSCEQYEDTNSISVARQVNIASEGLVWGTGVAEIPGARPKPMVYRRVINSGRDDPFVVCRHIA